MILQILKILLIILATLDVALLLFCLIKFGLRSLKMWGVFHLNLLMAIPSPLMFLIAYPFRKKIYSNAKQGKKTIFWYYTNATEKDFIDSWYGVYEFFNETNDIEEKRRLFEQSSALSKFIQSFIWKVLRNNSWNFRSSVIKGLQSPINYDTLEVIKYVDINGNPIEGGEQVWMNYNNRGVQNIRFELMNGRKEFRYSFTLPLNIWFGNRKYWNVQMGAYATRYDIKLRFYKN